MRNVIIRAASAAIGLSILLAGAVLAKGEAFTAVIGPIDPQGPDTAIQVPVEITVDGRAVQGDGPGFYLIFSEVTEGATLSVKAPLRYDSATGRYLATLSLPHAGRWQIDGGLENMGGGEPFGRIDGPRNVIVPEAAAPSVTAPDAPAWPVLVNVTSLLAGAIAASLLWLIGVAAFALRRRRAAAAASPGAVGRRVTA